MQNIRGSNHPEIESKVVKKSIEDIGKSLLNVCLRSDCLVILT